MTLTDQTKTKILDIVDRLIFKMTSAQWIITVIFMGGFVYAMVNSIDLPDYAVMLGTLIVKSYFDRDRSKG